MTHASNSATRKCDSTGTYNRWCQVLCDMEVAGSPHANNPKLGKCTVTQTHPLECMITHTCTCKATAANSPK